ncbi:MAG: PIN domain-containing protein [Steroidobacteraceae bacterium]
MIIYLDSTVLVAAVVEDEPCHDACLLLLRRKNIATWTHTLAEVFSTLTGGRLGTRVSPTVANQLISAMVRRLRLIELSASDVMLAIHQADAAGVQGGALYDYLHVIAARKVDATELHSINARHFEAVTRSGGPKIVTPE